MIDLIELVKKFEDYSKKDLFDAVDRFYWEWLSAPSIDCLNKGGDNTLKASQLAYSIYKGRGGVKRYPSLDSIELEELLFDAL